MALWKIFLISLGFAYDFSFCQNYGWLKLFHQKTPKIKFDALIFWGQFLKYDTKNNLVYAIDYFIQNNTIIGSDIIILDNNLNFKSKFGRSKNYTFRYWYNPKKIGKR